MDATGPQVNYINVKGYHKSFAQLSTTYSLFCMENTIP